MQNPNILNIYFYDNIKNDLYNFESSSLRKNLKASLELNDYRYLTNAIDERIEAVCYINFNDVNKFNYFRGKDFKKITFAFYSDFENDFKVLSFSKDKNKKYQIKESYLKTFSEYDLIFVPSEEAKSLLKENKVESNIEVLLPPIKRTKFELKDSELSKLIYIYFHIEENSKYVYTFLDSKDEQAAKRIIELARIFSNIKFIVIIPDYHTKEAKVVSKYFKRCGQNLFVSGILSEDIYDSLVYNASAFILLNSLYTASVELLEAYTCGVPVLSLSSSAFKDILIDKENSCVYNDFDAFINGFNDFLAGKLPDLKDYQKTFMKTNDIKKIGKKFIDYYREYFGEWLC